MRLGKTISGYFNRAMFRHHCSDYKYLLGKTHEISKGKAPFSMSTYEEKVYHAIKAYDYGRKYLASSENRRTISPEDKADFKDIAEHIHDIKKSLREGERKWQESKKRDLEQKAACFISITALIAGIIFLSPNITGNAIINVSQNSSNILGTVLLVIGLVAGFFWVRGR